MLRISSKSKLFLYRNHRLLRVVKSFNHVDSKTELKAIAISNQNVKEKLTKMSTTALEKYNEIIGYDEIDSAYKRVNRIQEDLAKTQTERTNLQLHINHIRQDLSNLQAQIQDTKRGEARYLELMRKGNKNKFVISFMTQYSFFLFLEFEIIQEKNRLEEKFDILDNQERELFAHLQAKINMLHEKSRTHMRQWGIISTIIGALLGIIGTSISAYYRNNDIRRVQQNFQSQFQDQIRQITKDTQSIVEGYTDIMEYLQKYEVTLKTIEPEKQQSNENRESWAGYFKRKTVSVWRWCTFQKSS